MPSLSKTTRNHDEIRQWAEARGGTPAHVISTGNSTDIGILRIDFPGFSGEGKLEPISWDDFFQKFDERNLSLVYQETTASGEKSNFNKLVSTAGSGSSKKSSGGKKAAGRGAGTSSRSSSSRSSAKKALVPEAQHAEAAARQGAKQAAGLQRKRLPAKALPPRNLLAPGRRPGEPQNGPAPELLASASQARRNLLHPAARRVSQLENPPLPQPRRTGPDRARRRGALQDESGDKHGKSRSLIGIPAGSYNRTR